MKLIDAFSPWLTELTAIRHSIHAWPELGFQENRTADTVANQLHDWGIETHRGLGVTGVVGIIAGNAPGGAIGLRADMDALPMRSEEHTSELQSLMRISYAVFCLQKKTK